MVDAGFLVGRALPRWRCDGGLRLPDYLPIASDGLKRRDGMRILCDRIVLVVKCLHLFRSDLL